MTQILEKTQVVIDRGIETLELDRAVKYYIPASFYKQALGNNIVYFDYEYREGHFWINVDAAGDIGFDIDITATADIKRNDYLNTVGFDDVEPHQCFVMIDGDEDRCYEALIGDDDAMQWIEYFFRAYPQQGGWHVGLDSYQLEHWVGSELADDIAYSKDPYSYYGVSKSDFA